MTVKSEITSIARASPGNALFSHAMKRIWDGDAGRSVRFWETFFWSVLAIVLGIKTFGWIDWLIVKITAWICYWIILISTPLTIGAWVYRVQMTVSHADESLRAIPIKPSEILLPRIYSVILTWARIFLPLLILLFVTGMIPSMGDYRDPFGIFTRFSVAFLAIPLNFEMFDGGLIDSTPVHILINFCALCYLVGGVTAPTAWGFWMAIRFRFSSFGFLTSQMVYYLFPIGIMWVTRKVYDPFRMFSFYISPDVYYSLIAQGLSLLLISFLCFLTTIKLIGRRQ